MGRKTSGRLTDPAPLVTATEDLARVVTRRVSAWPSAASIALGAHLLGAAIELAAHCLTAVPRDRGLPIGTSTSQYLAAHVYLNALDHHVKRRMKVPSYVRYVDDLFLFGQGRAELRAWRAEIGRWLGEERGLRLKHPEARILSCAGHLDGLGYRITRDDRRALPRTLKRLGRKVRADLAEVGAVDVTRSIAATLGVVMF